MLANTPTPIWKVRTGRKFSVKISGNFRKDWNKFPEIFWPHKKSQHVHLLFRFLNSPLPTL